MPSMEFPMRPTSKNLRRAPPSQDFESPPKLCEADTKVVVALNGIMFEKVLKRLCPCYFARSDESGSSACPTGPNKSETKQTQRLSERGKSDGTNLSSATSSSGGSSSSNAEDRWKGTLNLVQPQPVYAFPIDLKKPAKRKHKNLLKPPLYWKKTMKDLSPEGPPVFQESKHKNPVKYKKKIQKNTEFGTGRLRHSETVADITSVTSPSTVEARWLKSQSLEDVSLETSNESKRKLSPVKRVEGDRNWNRLKCRVFPEVCHGVVLFTATYFNKKKICLINIVRLEHLPKKGREGNSYYTVVKLSVLPSEKYIKCTKVLSNCSNPEVKEDFSFSVKELNGKTLRLSVFDASLQKQHEAIGHALLPLEDIISDQPKKYRIKLYKTTQPHICPGNISLSLKYTEEEDKFTLTADKGKNLSLQRDRNVKLNTYVKVSLYSYGEKIKTKKSVVALDCRDPKYNSTFTFQVRKDQIDHLSVGVAVKLKSFVNDLTIGRLNFGPFFYSENQKLTPWGRVFVKGELVSHWFRMYL